MKYFGTIFENRLNFLINNLILRQNICGSGIRRVVLSYQSQTQITNFFLEKYNFAILNRYQRTHGRNAMLIFNYTRWWVWRPAWLSSFKFQPNRINNVAWLCWITHNSIFVCEFDCENMSKQTPLSSSGAWHEVRMGRYAIVDTETFLLFYRVIEWLRKLFCVV